MSQAAKLVRELARTDLFRVRPAGITPANEIAGNPWGSAFQADVDPTGTPGETLLVADGSRVKLPDGVVARLDTFRGDAALRDYMFGIGNHRLPYAVKLHDSGNWVNGVEGLRQRFMTAENDSDAIVTMPYNELFEHALRHHVELTGPAHQNVLYALYFADQIKNLNENLSSLRDTVPPVRVNIPLEGEVEANALFFVTAAEMDARLLMGWKGSTNCQLGGKIRKKIMEGRFPARLCMQAVVPHQNNWHGIPAMFPYSMTGGIKGISIEPRLTSFAIDDWHRTRAEDLWGRVNNKLGADVVDRLFSERVVPFDMMLPPQGRMFRDGGKHDAGEEPSYITTSPPSLRSERWNWNAVEAGALLVHHVMFSDEVTDTFPVVLTPFAKAWVMVEGAMTITSPRGVEVHMKGGEACLIPALAQGDYSFAITQAPASFMHVMDAAKHFSTPTEVVLRASFIKGLASP